MRAAAASLAGEQKLDHDARRARGRVAAVPQRRRRRCALGGARGAGGDRSGGGTRARWRRRLPIATGRCGCGRRGGWCRRTRPATRCQRIRPAPVTVGSRPVRSAAADHAGVLAAGVHRHGQGHGAGGARGAGRTADGRELHRAGAPGLLRRPADPPRGAGVRGAGRRSARRWQWRPGLQHPRRAQRSRRMRAAPSAWRCQGPTPAAASGS